MSRRIRVIVPVLLLAVGIWATVAYLRSNRSGSDVVLASGTIEAQQVSIASKIPGRIETIHADEGDAVKAALLLVTMEGGELLAQVDQARAALEGARARLAQARAALALQRLQVEAQIAQAEAALDAARTRVPQAEEARTLTVLQSSLAVTQAESALKTAEANSAMVRVNLDRTARDLARLEVLFREGAISSQQVEAARAAHDGAQAQYEAAQLAVRQAEAALRLAHANQRQVDIRERDVAAAQAQVRQAEAALRHAKAGEEAVALRQADVAAAEAQVAQAEASVRFLLAQQKNLTITSPITGVVISRHASAGEVIGAGAPILTVGDLHEVWIRLFIPLPRLGGIVVGQDVEVSTDALPGRIFSGTVTEIAQQAEFTPRNVQTPEERVKQVFAVKVTLPNRDRLLKPGMPADATIKLR